MLKTTVVIVTLFTLAFAASAQAADPWPAATGGGSAAATVCSGVTYSMDDSSFLGAVETALAVAVPEPVEVGTNNWDEIAGSDVLGEWGLCDSVNDQMIMEFSRAGATNVPFHVSCSHSSYSDESTAWMNSILVSKGGGAADIETGSARFGLSSTGFILFGKAGFASIPTSGTVLLDHEDCIGVIAQATFGTTNGAFVITTADATCTVREVGPCTQPAP